MRQLHRIQLNILKDLLFSKSLRFADLVPYEMENSQFMFHLDSLMRSDYVEKKKGKYALTVLGREYANRIQIDSGIIETQAKITTVLCPWQSASV